jgi:hypothetical protein
MDILNGRAPEVKHQTGQSGQRFGRTARLWELLEGLKLEISG